MTTGTTIHTPPRELDPCGVPLEVEERSATEAGHGLPGLAAGAVLARVVYVQRPTEREWLVWGTADGRNVLFWVDEITGSELEAELAMGEEPSALVEPGQLIATDLDLFL